MAENGRRGSEGDAGMDIFLYVLVPVAIAIGIYLGVKARSSKRKPGMGIAGDPTGNHGFDFEEAMAVAATS
jgi:hypothetical protein